MQMSFCNPSFIVCTVCLVTVHGVAHAAEWSPWTALPDRYQGAIDLRFREAGKKNEKGYEFQLRNRYRQKVTVTVRLTGAAQTVERTVVLESGEKKTKDNTQQASLATLDNAAIVTAIFEGTPPPPTAAGFSFAAANLPHRRAALEDARKLLKIAEQAETNAQRQSAALRDGVSTGHAKTGNSGDPANTAGIGDVEAQQENARRAADQSAEIRKFVAALEQEVKESEVAAAPVPAEASATPLTAALTPTTATMPAPAAKVEVKQLIETANQAAQKGEWEKVETALTTLRAQDAYARWKDVDKGSIAFNLGSAYGHDNKLAEAESAFREAVRLDPKNAQYHDGLGASLANQGKFADAETAFQAAVKLDGNNPQFQAHLKKIQEVRKQQGSGG